MEIIGIKTSIFQESENLFDFLHRFLPSLQEGDVIAITSKIVALSQGRTGELCHREDCIHEESEESVATPWATLTRINNEWCINAGIDESNAKNNLVLLPKDPQKIANDILKHSKETLGIEKLGVIITDTKSTPLRIGTIGRTIGFAGFQPLRDYRGKQDLFGRESRLTQSNIADALSASAVLLMGEGNECIPLVVLRNAPVEFISQYESPNPLSIPPEKDIFSYLYLSKKQEK